jgi:3-dehydroquinate dehydratase/shikimate dehydrogenase
MNGKANICVAVRQSTTRAAVDAAARVARWADLVEIRADYIRDLDLELLLARKPCPILFTLRSAAEGGVYRGPERTRLETIRAAADRGADLVDVEMSAYWKAVLDHVPRERVVMSYHDFERTPEDLEAKLEALAATGAGTLKVATRARTLADNVRIARLLGSAGRRGLQVIALAMGRAGIPSRVFGPLWGSWLTYASDPEGEPTADGQIPADELAESYAVRSISASTDVYAVVGAPLGHSLSPRIHNAAFRSAGRDAVFIPLEAASAVDFFAFQELCPVRGAAVTIPYKEEMHARARSLSVAAESTGAVNTLVRVESGWHGENTDIDGFLRPLMRRMHLGRVRAAVLGSGGAARSAVYALRSQGASVALVARNAAKARALAEQFQAESLGWETLQGLQWDLLVNTTPVGMYPDVEATPVPAELLRPGAWVYDLVYNPAATRLLTEARERGCSTIGGAEMFLAQALRQQQIWFGAVPDDAPMRRALEEALSQTGAGVKQDVLA